MDLVIRLKRPRNVDPFEALVLASKRRKKDDSQEVSSEIEPSRTILKFAGTIDHEEEDISAHIVKAREHVGLKSRSRLNMKDIRRKTRLEASKTSKENRLKVVNMSRTISDVQQEHSYAAAPGEPSKSSGASQFTIVDVVHDEDVTENKDVEVENDDQYVYSLYFANSAGGELNDGFLDSLVSVMPLDSSSAKLFDYNDHSDEDSNPDDEDDSNDENNWRNDYPDSDYEDDRQNSDASMENMMNNIKLNSDNELSSDDGEGDLPYGADEDQVLNLGKGYAQYKLKVMKEFEDDLDDYASEIVSSESEEDS